MALKLFTERESGSSVAINQETVKYIREFQGATKIIFGDTTYLVVSDTYLEVVARLNEKK